MDFKQFQLLLRTRGVQKDKATFEKWSEGKININQCFKEFMLNNGYKFSYKINDYDTPYKVEKIYFKNWLNSLGYYRDKKDSDINEKENEDSE